MAFVSLWKNLYPLAGSTIVIAKSHLVFAFKSSSSLLQEQHCIVSTEKYEKIVQYQYHN